MIMPKSMPPILNPLLLASLGLALCQALLVPVAHAYTIDGSKWPGAETEFYVSLSGSSATGVPWQTAFEQAMEAWNTQTNFNFVLRREFRHPCANDTVNSVEFTADVCGSQFGDNTLAVTLRAWHSEILGPPRLVKADIVINSNKSFDVYNGSPIQPGKIFTSVDFRRVALHELGHALGLDHTTVSPAIMQATINNNDQLRQDDIDGVNALYGGLTACAIEPLLFGATTDALASGDCTVDKLTVGGSDDSFIDVRRLVLTAPSTITVDMKSDTLDSVLLLADARLRFLAMDDNGGGGCNARLTQQLNAGTYYLLSNTYDQASTCAGIVGPYRLEVSHQSTGAQGLGAVVSLQGNHANAQFSGGITANNGLNFGNRFRPQDSLDINASIGIDGVHQGLAGFLVVAVLIDGQLSLMNESGALVPYNGGPLVVAAQRILGSTESIEIARDLVPAQLGIQALTADFLVGYGLSSNPAEVYYHQTPLNLVIAP